MRGLGTSILLVLCSVHPVYGAEKAADHTAEKSLRPRAVVNSIDNVSLTTLGSAITVIKKKTGEFEVFPTNSEEGGAAREEIRNQIEGTRLLDWATDNATRPVKFKVYDESLGEFVETEVPGLGALLAVAVSLPSHDANREGRRLFTKDRDGKTISIFATTKESETLEQVNLLLKLAREALKNQAPGPQTVTFKLADDEPSSHLLNFSSADGTYHLEDHNLYPRWQARREARKLARNPLFIEKLQEMVKANPASNAEDITKVFLEWEEVQPIVHSALAHSDSVELRKQIARGVERHMSWRPNPNDPNAVSIHETPVVPYQPIIDVAPEDIPTVAVVGQRDGKKFAQLAKTHGADLVYSGNSAREIAEGAEAAYAQYQKPVRLYISAHGCAGSTANCSNRDAGLLNELGSRLRGKVHSVVVLGCSVGAGVRNFRMNHMVRAIAAGVRGDVPVCAVDRTLWFNSKYYLQQHGNLVTVYGKEGPAISSEELISTKPVWED